MRRHHTNINSKLIADCIAGRRQSQRELYEMLAPKMFAVSLRYTKNFQDAEDLLQDSFLKIFANLHKFRNEGNFEGWIRRIVINTCLVHITRTTKFDDISEITEPMFIDHNSGLDKLYKEDIYKAMNGLSKGYKTVFNLYSVEGYSHKEISALLGITESTSKSQYSRAKATLRKQYKRVL